MTDTPQSRLPPLNIVVATQPNLRGQLSIHLPENHSVARLPNAQFVELWTAIKQLISFLNSASTPVRYAAATDGTQSVQLFPIRPLVDKWEAITSGNPRLYDCYPGFLTSGNGPRAKSEDLESTQGRITKASGWKTPSYDYLDDPSDDNLFAKLVRGEIPQWRVWEDDAHVAFLTPFANTTGFTVLVPRRHLSSNVLSLNDSEFAPLMGAVWKVSQFLKQGLQVPRVGIFVEGFEIDYAHVKLIPVQADSDDGESQTATQSAGPYLEEYPGFLSTQLGPLRSPTDLYIPPGFEEARGKWLNTVNSR